MKTPLNCIVKKAPKKIIAGLILIGLLACFAPWASGVLQNPIDQQDTSLKDGLRQTLQGHVPAAVANSQVLSNLNSAQRLELLISLPLRNKIQMGELRAQIYDPTSTNYHHYLTPARFTELFGPTEEDYKSVIAYFQSNDFAVAKTYPGRTSLDVIGTVASIEKAFNLHLHYYRMPGNGRVFFAPETEPSLGLAVPILAIGGLNSHSKYNQHTNTAFPLAYKGGTGPDGNLLSQDLRKAYARGLPLTGVGQVIGIYGNYDAPPSPEDIAKFEELSGLSPTISIIPIVLGTNSSNSAPTNTTFESALDVEMAIAMAPGVSTINFYWSIIGGTTENLTTRILDEMINPQQGEQLPRLITSSWWFDTSVNQPSVVDDKLHQMSLQGQSFFAGSGDTGAYCYGTNSSLAAFADSTNIIIVGGTDLITDTNKNYLLETVWNDGYCNDGAGASSGGVSPGYPIPWWQTNIDMSTNGGSSTWRNLPDVSMAANHLTFVYNNTIMCDGGVSASSPLWAGFAALINQQAESNGRPPVGMINPALYAICASSDYTNCFNDIVIGTNVGSPGTELEFAL